MDNYANYEMQPKKIAVKTRPMRDNNTKIICYFSVKKVECTLVTTKNIPFSISYEVFFMACV